MGALVRDSTGSKSNARASISETLSELAESAGASLVTISSHGRRNLREMVFGSTTESVLRLIARPVVVFPVEYLVNQAGMPAREPSELVSLPTDLHGHHRQT
jgi:hypothetical protein